MTFSIEEISYLLGENEVKLEDLCKENSTNFDRLMGRSGFELLHTTNKEEITFFSQAITPDFVQKLRSGDLIILVNQSLESSIPSTMLSLFEGKNIPNDLNFISISDGCTGFARALLIADKFMNSGQASAHIICAEKYSKFYESSNMTLSPIFTDAISITTLKSPGDLQIIDFEIFNDLSKSSNISNQGVGKELKLKKELTMKGAEVLAWTLNFVPKSIYSILHRNKLNLREVNHWYLHQGSKVVVEEIQNKMGIETPNLFRASQVGNSVSSSIPILMSENLNQHLPPGELVLISTFGVGLSSITLLLKTVPC